MQRNRQSSAQHLGRQSAIRLLSTNGRQRAVWVDRPAWEPIIIAGQRQSDYPRQDAQNPAILALEGKGQPPSYFPTTSFHIAAPKRLWGKAKDKARGRAFLDIFEPLFDAYQMRLGDRIDFEDMIVRATEHVQSGRYKSPYRHLLVDEFQDISEGRARLLLALKAQHDNARIFAVGDDWQSIYRFTGSDIHLMRNFGREFGGVFAGRTDVHSTVDLGRTFRSVDKIAGPARSFVLKNPSQITKQVVPISTTPDPAIKVAHYGWGEEDAVLRAALDEIQTSCTGGNASVLLLGRYHFVKPDNFARLRSSYPTLSVRFMTVH